MGEMSSAPDAGERGGEAPSDPPAFERFPVLSTERVYHSIWCGLRRDQVVLPDGRAQEYHVVEIPDAVVVVPVTREGSIVMIGQYRYPHGKTHWEIPAGRIMNGEGVEECARREVREETGYRAGRLYPLPGFYPVNGISAHYAHAFAALDCEREGEPELEPSERIVVRPFSRGEVGRLLASGRIQDAFTALTLFYHLQLGGR
jgi:ADP-ribose pyrophosphatase